MFFCHYYIENADTDQSILHEKMNVIHEIIKINIKSIDFPINLMILGLPMKYKFDNAAIVKRNFYDNVCDYLTDAYSCPC